MLSHYLTTDMIRLRVTVPDWPAAVQVAGGILVEAGLCKPAYVEAIIENVRTLGPYIVLAPGLALAHAHTEAGVLQTGVSLVTLDPPVSFGSADNDPVRVVFAFGVADPNEHIDLLSELAQFLGCDAYYARVQQADTPAAVRQVIHDFETRA